MKKSLFQFLIIFSSLIISIYSTNWKLSIKSENSSSDTITLIPGVFQKIILELTSTSDPDLTDTSSFKISLKTKGIISKDSEIVITPTESQIYSTFIGISCLNSSSSDSIKLEYEIKNSDISTKSTLSMEPVNAIIERVKTKINISPLLEIIPGTSYNLFRMSKEIFNVDSIEIIPKIINSSSSDNKIIEFKNIVISSFNKRNEISGKNPLNNGILFDFPFGTQKTFDEIVSVTKNKFPYSLQMKDDFLEKCFELEKTSFTLGISQDSPINLNDSVKQAIVYNTEFSSKKFDKSNNIKIDTIIPLVPLFVSCEIRHDTKFSDSEDKDDVKFFKLFITQSGKFSLKFDNLSSDSEYFAKCTLSNTHIDESKRKKFTITMGNFESADIIRELLPSRTKNRIPTCVKFKFNSIIQEKAFNLVAPKICNYFMQQVDRFYARGLTTIGCEILDTLQILDTTTTLCVYPIPLYNIGQFLQNLIDDKFNEYFDKLVDKIMNSPDVFEKMGLPKMEISLVNKHYDDETIDTKKINLKLIYKYKEFFRFDVISNNKQPIECYYNQYLSRERSRFLSSLIQKSVILNPGESKSIETSILTLDKNKGDLYSLYFRCYNLPGFTHRYENTGNVLMYTYYYNEEVSKQEVVPEIEITINCNDKNNKLNPHCLKSRINMITDNLKTKVPEIINKVLKQAEKFQKLSINAQNEFLNNLDKSLKETLENQNENIKNIFEKVLEMLYYLSYTDCSVYSSGNTNNESDTIKGKKFIECRKIKKNFLSRIINWLQNNLTCDKINKIITTKETENYLSMEEKVKYILLVINEITHNPESLEKGQSKIIIDLINCIYNRFDPFWEKLKNNLIKEENYILQSVEAIKKDLINLLIQAMTNLVDVLHFDELDGYIEKSKLKITRSGLMLYDQGIKIQKNILDFVKNLNQFGNHSYNLSLSVTANVLVKENLESEKESDIYVIDLENKGIKILIHSNFLLKKKNAYALQMFSFESPLVSVKASGKKEGDAISTFISVTLFDKEGKEISVYDIEKEFRTEILYKMDKFKNIKNCFFYNDNSEDLEQDGLNLEKDFVYQGEKYYKCSSDHLTAFTAGTYSFDENEEDDVEEGLKWWSVLLVILAIIVLTTVAFIVYIKIKKRQLESDEIESNEESQEETLVN